MADRTSLFDPQEAVAPGGPVECLGMTFESDAERRVHFLQELEKKLPDLRKRPDFPVADDDEILRLSDPPYHTACPNPFLAEFVRHYGEQRAGGGFCERQPYTGSMRASARNPVYSFHPYSTKVPPEIIRAFIEHYSSPGDLVFDGFCGTGMTGVAARESGRHAILNDLSPIAAFVAGINTRSHDRRRVTAALQGILEASAARWGHLYETRDGGRPLTVNYFVWSDVFTCPECACEFPFFPHGVIHHGNKVETRPSFPCPSCDAELNVRRVQRVLTHDGKKRRLVWVNAGLGNRRISRAPTSHDRELARDIERIGVPSWFPTDPVNPKGYSARLAQLGDKAVGDVSRFLSGRNLVVLADLWERAQAVEEASTRRLVLATLTSVFTVISERQGYFGGGGGMSGNLYMPIVRMEKNVYDVVRRKLTKLEAAERSKQALRTAVAVATASATDLQVIPDDSIDYIYTDPPFGANIIYTEMNLPLEAWLRIRTNGRSEAVMDDTRGRAVGTYAELMRRSFVEFRRILKPGRWMTVEFHNTKAAVWNLIQAAIGESGFVVAQVGVLDKGSTTILADIRPGAAKQDLVISAYKPDHGLEERFRLGAGTEDGVWDFVRTHLRQLPTLPDENGQASTIAERQRHLLFDRMVAFHVKRGVTVPLGAEDFYEGLVRRFPQRDGMYFLPDQAAAYDRARMTVREVGQPGLVVDGEETATPDGGS